jgi:hypothetical protein
VCILSLENPSKQIHPMLLRTLNNKPHNILTERVILSVNNTFIQLVIFVSLVCDVANLVFLSL